MSTPQTLQITNIRNEGIHCHGRDKWWIELEVPEVEVIKALTRNRGMRVRDIHTSSLLTHVRVVSSMVQHSMLPKSGNINAMSGYSHVLSYDKEENQSGKIDLGLHHCYCGSREKEMCKLSLWHVFDPCLHHGQIPSKR